MRLQLLSLISALSLVSVSAFAEPALQEGETLESLSKVKISITVNGQPGSIQDLVSSGQIHIISDSNQVENSVAQDASVLAAQDTDETAFESTTESQESPLQATPEAHAATLDFPAQAAPESNAAPLDIPTQAAPEANAAALDFPARAAPESNNAAPLDSPIQAAPEANTAPLDFPARAAPESNAAPLDSPIQASPEEPQLITPSRE